MKNQGRCVHNSIMCSCGVPWRRGQKRALRPMESLDALRRGPRRSSFVCSLCKEARRGRHTIAICDGVREKWCMTCSREVDRQARGI